MNIYFRMNVDLDINNYDLEDILNLFNLEKNFNNDDLAYAKKIVMKTHPDKSGLDKEVFLFYCKAFRALKNINDFRNKESKCTFNKYRNNYYSNNFDTEGNIELVNKLMKKKKGEFNNWFNKLFEKLNLNDDLNDGYGEWLKDNENTDNEEISNLNTMHERMEQKKRNMSQLVRKKDFTTIENNTNQCFLDGTNNFNSDVFSNLKYQDLKDAHTETLIPVCNDDYNNRLKFNNVNSYKEYRNNQNLQSLSKEESEKILNNDYINNENIASDIAYKLLRQEERNREKNKIWWSNLKLLS